MHIMLALAYRSVKLKSRNYQQLFTVVGKSNLMAQLFSSQHYSAVGVLRATWTRPDGATWVYQYSTGWLIAPRLLLTCQHAIFNQQYHIPAAEVIFIPAVAQGPIDEHQLYRAETKNYYRAIQIKRAKQTLRQFPTLNELCLIVLQDPVTAHYIRIGSLEIEQYSRVEIIGYPSQHYWAQIQLQDILVQRKHQRGIVKYVSGEVINHSVPTEKGMSGSPILALSPDGQVYAIGMQTHAGFNSSTNSGLFFTRQVLRLLRRFQQELVSIHRIQPSPTFGDESVGLWDYGCRLVRPAHQDESSWIHLSYEQAESESDEESMLEEIEMADQLELFSSQQSSKQGSSGSGERAQGDDECEYVQVQVGGRCIRICCQRGRENGDGDEQVEAGDRQGSACEQDQAGSGQSECDQQQFQARYFWFLGQFQLMLTHHQM